MRNATQVDTVEIATAQSDPAVIAPRRRRDVVLWLAVGWITLVIVCAVLADVLPFVDRYDKRFPRAF
ncbi:MAG: hypothetical protein AB7V43_18645, partial [Acidimicrobiia bacterium]